MKIGILGTGVVAKALGKGFIGGGHEVMLGSREGKNEKIAEWLKEMGPRACGGTFAEAAKFGELLVVATLGTGTENALKLAGPDHFKGKVVIDTTNPLDYSKGMPPGLFASGNDSLGERIQKQLPGAHVVKAFNSVGNALMVNPRFNDGPPDMFICGDDAAAKRTVEWICRGWGWDVIDVGGISSSRYLEALCLLWVLHGVQTGQWTHAFKVLHK